jgi:hypothetical protein
MSLALIVETQNVQGLSPTDRFIHCSRRYESENNPPFCGSFGWLWPWPVRFLGICFFVSTFDSSSIWYTFYHLRPDLGKLGIDVSSVSMNAWFICSRQSPLSIAVKKWNKRSFELQTSENDRICDENTWSVNGFKNHGHNLNHPARPERELGKINHIWYQYTEYYGFIRFGQTSAISFWTYRAMKTARRWTQIFQVSVFFVMSILIAMTPICNVNSHYVIRTIDWSVGPRPKEGKKSESSPPGLCLSQHSLHFLDYSHLRRHPSTVSYE